MSADCRGARIAAQGGENAPLPTLCDARDACCGTPACLDAGLWWVDPYDEPVFVQGHSHAEPICAWPDCETYLTRSAMATLRKGQSA